jgi:orotate phosphoribosyltransferase
VNKKEILGILNEAGAIITNSHIVYTSGKHGSTYINKDAIYPHTGQTSQLCLKIAERFFTAGVEAVVGPAVGGVILSQWTAYHLTRLTGFKILAVYADKVADDFIIRRGYDKLIDHKHVLVVEDVITTGGSVKKTIQAVLACGGTIAGVGALCNRGDITSEDLGIRKLFALVNVKFKAWDEEECPLCAKGVPINIDVGKGREFLARKNLT